MNDKIGMQHKICPECQTVELTAQEEATRSQRCYWCEMDYVRTLRATLGDEVASRYKMPTPEDFGRTEQEIIRGRPDPNKSLFSNPSIPSRNGDEKVGFQKDPNPNNPDWDDQAKLLLKELAGLDVDDPPQITVVEAHGNAGTKLRLEFPEGIDQKTVDIIESMLDVTLIQIVKLLVFGTKHDAVLSQMRDMLNGRNNGQEMA